MTKYISLETKEQNRFKKTVFTKHISSAYGISDTINTPEDFEKVVYLGRCKTDGDIFVAYSDKEIYIYKGIKGDEF